MNAEIKIKKIPAKKYIVIRFSGVNSDKNVKKHEKVLFDYVERNKLAATKSAKYAFYNPPWTLPPLRRNEVMFELIAP